MMDFLEKLKRRPEQARKRIAVLSTFAIFSGIFGVWWISWNTPATEGAVTVKDVVSPLGVVVKLLDSAKDRALTIGDDIKGQLRYAASGTAADLSAEVAGTNIDHTSAQDVVYPDKIFGTDSTK
jgi:hypothetical protein